MNDIEKVTYFPKKLTKNSLVIINYFGSLNNNQKLYIEFSYDDISSFNTSLRKTEMSKLTDYSLALITIEDATKLYFRFVDNNGNIDDNNGMFYQKTIEQESTQSYSEISSLLSEYKNSNNNSHIATNIVTNDIQTPQTSDSFENNNNIETPCMALVPLKDQSLARKGLRLSYKLNKRIKLLLIKLFRKLPSFITGNYRRRINL